jgi:D-alanine-D-alanine ligase-like ATP-grasp enzyme
MRPLWPHSISIVFPTLTEEAKASSPKEILLANEYGRYESVVEIKSILESISGDCKVSILPVTLEDFQTVIGNSNLKEETVFLNLCDGTEDDEYPGVSVVKFLEKSSLAFTGSLTPFYEITTSKPVLKIYLQKAHVPTAAFVELDPNNIEKGIREATLIANWPLIVKPSISYASISITSTSVVDDVPSAIKQAKSVFESTKGGVFVETFLAGIL